MASERQRLIELALESLQNKKKEIDAEIEELTRELRGGRGRRAVTPAAASKAPAVGRARRKRSRFTKEERLRRSRRMKAYWENWRKQKKGQK
jgi:cell division septum initiation protein DivIVA